MLNYKLTSTVTLLCLFPPCSLFSPFSCSLSSSSLLPLSLFPVLSVLLFSLFLLSSPHSPCSLRSLVLSLPPLFSHSHCSLFSQFSCSLSSSHSSPTLTVPCSLRSLVRVREEEEREQENGENREQGALRRRGGIERTGNRESGKREEEERERRDL